VPGAGRAYDAAALAADGTRSVVAVDVSPTACAEAERYLASLPLKPEVAVVCGDFFSLEGDFDLVWDCTFLCALDPSTRETWAAKMNELLKPDGALCTLIFPIGKPPGDGPPWDLSLDLLRDLLAPHGFKPTKVTDFPPRTHMDKAPFGNTVALWERE